jgi:tripartite-type tricarboxylate transporter receptor subunit TctC
MRRCQCSGIFVSLSLSLSLLSSFLYETTFAAPVDFPKKEITIIVNMGPGGGRDVLARGVGNKMSKYLGVPVVVMNKPGAGGATGLISLYHSAADGYTIGVGMATDIIDQILEKREYDNKRFIYLGRAQSSPGFLFVKSDSPFRSVKDFKTFGKPVRHATFSMTSNSTVVPMVIANREGFTMVIVGGYKGAADAAMALVRGEVEFAGPGLVAAMPFLRAGQIRPILTIHQKRSPDFPDIPTVGEIGHPDLDIWALDFWFMTPPGVPKERVQILEDSLMKTLKDSEFLGWAKGAGVDPAPLDGEENTKMVFKLFGLLEQYKGDIDKYVREAK